MNTSSLISIFVSGKLVPLKSTKNSVQLKVLYDWTEMSFNDLITEETEQASEQQKQTFICSMDGCIREFKNHISLDQHLLQGSCEYKLEKGPLKIRQILYAQKLSNNVHHCPDMQTVLLENACTSGLSAKEIGWALKVKKKNIFFSIKQKEFMTDLFN
ncbi:unnamed protein product [Mytilus coruscus]|uniref:Uncharacterized protein n=1 Tax=Mytilus coruscus TaxID=42192 RepID=A0A6J8CVL5_MYTCO|nr:unnamed protein product [Mytilus coruscus]